MEFGFYQRHYSTETDMLRVLSDVLTAVDGRRVTLVGLLDMSAVRLQHLEKNFGLTVVVLISFLTDRTQEIFYNGWSTVT